MDDFRFNLTAIRGQQSQQVIYLVIVPFRLLLKFLNLDTGPVLERSQRKTDPARTNRIVNYLKRNTSNYVLPPLVGCLEDGDFRFTPAAANSCAGTISFSMEAKFKLFDGQTRASSIIAVLKERPALSQDNIAIQLYTDLTLKQRQQAFSDINSNAKSVSRSLTLTYDHRDAYLSKLAEEINKVRAWRGKIDHERNQANHKNNHLFSYRHVVAASVIVLGITKAEAPSMTQLLYVSSWWNSIAAAVGWDEPNIDVNKVTVTAAGLMSLARLGALIRECNKSNPEINQFDAAQRMFEVDWDKGAEMWQGVLVKDGKMTAGKAAEEAAVAVLAKKLKIDHMQGA
ncbi:DGQHR domain-containing protein [Rheinheimera pacifica]|uniref:DNA sulfur modification protein DndB n=1 Tax=Rheinheimera pacifica TaxID=173990 RepID=UPI0021685FC5|nr:DNA sulfur modification protein DndB [Rheinheimera pacifica]MCS4309466.1 DGQHR domain-containing protein [Rheinheimera pacifica]